MYVLPRVTELTYGQSWASTARAVGPLLGQASPRDQQTPQRSVWSTSGEAIHTPSCLDSPASRPRSSTAGGPCLPAAIISPITTMVLSPVDHAVPPDAMDDADTPEVRLIYLPAQYAARATVSGSEIRQLRRRAVHETMSVLPFVANGRAVGEVVIRRTGARTLVVARSRDIPAALPAGVDEVLIVPARRAPSEVGDVTRGVRWSSPAPTDATSAEWGSLAPSARASWDGRVSLREEVRDGDRTVRGGLRAPQLGAIYAALAHWTTTAELATVVMPTGTGKTETMLSLLAHHRPERLLVVVPTDALRTQIAGKFEGFGVLKDAGVIGADAAFPVVGVLTKIPPTPEDVRAFASGCNVVVTTMAIAGRATEQVQAALAAWATHLFIDEAHHVVAPTWAAFRRAFAGQAPARPVLQFTATPFRSDGKHVDGRVIYNYPLRKAQAEQYFKPIVFHPVREYDPADADEAIAEVALQHLARDLAAGHDHLVMARTNNIARAQTVYDLYRVYGPEHAPVLVHSDMPEAERCNALRAITQRTSRVIVCVNMLGEGFDLPELKIAALHDVHKSLAITIQFVGRFTRTKPALGNATVIANIANAGVEEALRELYAEDADWNHLLRRLSEGATGRQAARTEFFDAFEQLPDGIPIQNVVPRMSTVVFRTKCTAWRPDRVHEAVDDRRLYGVPVINREHRVLAFVTRELEEVDWGDIRELVNVTWHLHAVHWDAERNLLFVHSSDNSSVHQALADAVAGPSPALIRGEPVYRCLAGITRLTLHNAGLNDVLSRNRRFTMHMGANLSEPLTGPQLATKVKTNLFGRGYEKGGRASAGASRKGRMWSHWRAADLGEWLEWCHALGDKLLDDSISVDAVLAGALKPELVTARPTLVPVAIEWGADLWRRPEARLELDVAGARVPFLDAGIELTGHTASGPLGFRVVADREDGSRAAAEYEIVFADGRVEYRPTGFATVDVVVSRQRTIALSEWLQRDPPIVLFADTSYLDYNELYRISGAEAIGYDRAKIQAWDWAGIDIERESQTPAKRANSVQYRVIQQLLEAEHVPVYDIVFDDDAPGEIADVVALAVDGVRLIIDLYHCKFAGAPTPGARVEDLYAVCGQAQRSVEWKSRVERLLDRLPHRDTRRRKWSSVSRFERGTLKALSAIRQRLPELVPELRVTIVQPGLSRAEASVEQLKLLGATELYLNETFTVPLRVIASK
jgi:superfamily II DNA or RNA helicase